MRYPFTHTIVRSRAVSTAARRSWCDLTRDSYVPRMSILDLTRDDHAYFFGLFQTDGHLSAQTRNRGRAAIELSSQDDAVLRALPALFPGVTCHLSTRTRTTNFAANHTSTTWSVHARAMREELAALGVPVGRKSASVGPPTAPFCTRGYVRGLVDGDGSVGFTGSGAPFVSFVTASPQLATYFCAVIEQVTGVVRRVRPNARDGVHNPMVTNDPAAALAGWLYPPGCLAIPRKSAAAEAVAQWSRPVGMRARPRSVRRWDADQDQVVRLLTDADAARALDRTERSVQMRRWRLRRTGGDV